MSGRRAVGEITRISGQISTGSIYHDLSTILRFPNGVHIVNINLPVALILFEAASARAAGLCQCCGMVSQYHLQVDIIMCFVANHLLRQATKTGMRL